MLDKTTESKGLSFSGGRERGLFELDKIEVGIWIIG